MHAVEYAETAQRGLLSIVEYIARDNPRRARTFVDELRTRIERKLSAFPMSGVEVGPRRFSTFGNYLVVYRVDEAASKVSVPMVTEGHRNWRRLLEGL